MSNERVPQESLIFLKRLAKNNNREWFTEHKKEFKAVESSVKEFYNSLHQRMSLHDEIEKFKMFRIYRDVRFSKDKTPYKTHFAGSYARAGEHRRGGYYLRIKPGETFIAVGFWEPNKEDLLRIRKEFENDASEFREIITSPGIRGTWGSLQGEELKTAPKGFDKEHPDIDLIRKKQFIFVKNYTDKEVMDPGFIEDVNSSFKAIRPYFDLMSDILTTNLNGESLLK
ncbi:DUF2461 domain-containing protein [Zeaxanthinibacter sp. PT1]|uniref:DUF2461 domain-containing protein n=1 Tax=Zeaxanthinibacter TaxID=561554 RepID=UPI0023497395|nr:DUF2461 domain-containing protein [Zeaxanthinibacter sp. PT1]MDC6351545.1 DUF2461 domain-containing protein [Zeaxanthinibacter sp. PT1]